MYLYLLINQQNKKLYLGITKDLKRRLIEHNLPNNHFTGRTKGIWRLLFYKKFNDKTVARREEIRLKKAKNKKYIYWYFRNFGSVA